MLGNLATKANFSTQAGKAASAGIDILGAAKMDGTNLPRAPTSAFRKRPVRLVYDKNDFWSFRMPSEKAFLLQNFDAHSMFGVRHGLQHSPHLRAQMDIDSRLLLGLVGLSFLMLGAEFKQNGKLLNLRDNFRSVTYGRFEADDFIEKK